MSVLISNFKIPSVIGPHIGRLHDSLNFIDNDMVWATSVSMDSTDSDECTYVLCNGRRGRRISASLRFINEINRTRADNQEMSREVKESSRRIARSFAT